jgi:hypothetical protein
VSLGCQGIAQIGDFFVVRVELLENVDCCLHQGLVRREIALLRRDGLKLAITGGLNGVNIFILFLEFLEILANIAKGLLYLAYFSSSFIILLFSLLNQYLILVKLFLLSLEIDLLLLNT